MIPDNNEQTLLDEGYFRIFKTGTHTDMSGKKHTFTEADLDQTVLSYDRGNTAFKEAPVCLGHPTDNKPAYAWVKGLKRVGKFLYANVKDLKPELVEAVKDGYYKYVSPKFRLDKSLQHLAVLGAVPPAVPGLADLQEAFQRAYSESDEGSGFVLSFAELDAYQVESQFSSLKNVLRNLKNWIIKADTLEKADEIIPEHILEWLAQPVTVDESKTNTLTYSEKSDIKEVSMAGEKPDTTKEEPEKPKTVEPVEVKTPAEEPAFSEKDLNNPVVAALLGRLDALEKRATAAETSLTAAQEMQKKTDDAAFAEEMCKKGIIAPVMREPLIKLLGTLPEGESLSFAEGEKEKTPREFLKGFLEKLNPMIPLTPLKMMRRGTEEEDLLGFSESEIDEQDLELDRSARRIAKEKNIPYPDALRIAQGGAL
jgi:hypothetical protein